MRNKKMQTFWPRKYSLIPSQQAWMRACYSIYSLYQKRFFDFLGIIT